MAGQVAGQCGNRMERLKVMFKELTYLFSFFIGIERL